MGSTEKLLGSDQVGLPDQADARSGLAGPDKVQLLLFNLGSEEKFGINVFKVKEVCQAGKITFTPNMPRGVEGFVNLHGNVIPVLNLANLIGIKLGKMHQRMMVAEFNDHLFGFLVHRVDRIIRVDWDKVRATEGMLSDKGALITTITELEDGSLVSILDVEQVLANAFGEAVVGNVEKVDSKRDLCIFFADDSMLARRRIAEVLDKMGVKYIQANNGNEAWEKLKIIADSAQRAGADLRDQIQAILTDAEMPEMDGYALTQRIKSDSRFDNIPVVMHSSLSYATDRFMGRRVGVDHYVTKFDSIVLSSTLRRLLT